jgi:hypothetical protein
VEVGAGVDVPVVVVVVLVAAVEVAAVEVEAVDVPVLVEDVPVPVVVEVALVSVELLIVVITSAGLSPASDAPPAKSPSESTTNVPTRRHDETVRRPLRHIPATVPLPLPRCCRIDVSVAIRSLAFRPGVDNLKG